MFYYDQSETEVLIYKFWQLEWLNCHLKCYCLAFKKYLFVFTCNFFANLFMNLTQGFSEPANYILVVPILPLAWFLPTIRRIIKAFFEGTNCQVKDWAEAKFIAESKFGKMEIMLHDGINLIKIYFCKLWLCNYFTA